MFFTRDNILDIALIFEEANGNALDDNDALLVKRSGLSELLPSDIEEMLIDSLQEDQPEEYRGLVYWALGKRFNLKLRPLFKKWLADEVALNYDVPLYQLLIALDNLKEPVWGADREGSVSVEDTELNFRDARIYLENCA